jgi:hypothetical protein
VQFILADLLTTMSSPSTIYATGVAGVTADPGTIDLTPLWAHYQPGKHANNARELLRIVLNDLFPAIPNSPAPRLGNKPCYLRFVLLVNGRSSPGITAACP